MDVDFCLCAYLFFLTVDARKHEPPLSYLFQDDKLSLDSAAVIYKLHTSENIEYV